MSIGPLLPGRLPTSLVAGRLQSSLAEQNRLLTRLQDQAATGQKFFRPSESPAAAARTIFLQRTLERQTQLQTNLVTDRSMLQASDTALMTVSDALNEAKGFLMAGTGDSTTSAEKQAMAVEVASLLRGVVNAANASFRGRYLFGGSESRTVPFEILKEGVVRYNGDGQKIDSFVDFNLLVANNVDGKTAFEAMTTPVSKDVDPALTPDTKVADLLGGRGVELGTVLVTLDDGVNPPQTEAVDLSTAETIGDLQTRLEAAFPPGALVVDIDPAAPYGLQLSPAGGTVAVADREGSTVARDLGIAGEATATIEGGDLDPRLTPFTPLSALNGGTGIGPTDGNGLLITNGSKTSVVDLDSAATVQDVLNLIKAADPDLDVGINDAGNGLAVSSRLSGVDFSIGENNGSNAAALGIRTMNEQTRLSDLNGGSGVPVDDGVPLEIVRRDGTAVSIDLSGTKTVQQVLDAINAVDPGNLEATLNAVGNGISITDNSGTGPLVVAENLVSTALGIDGQEPGNDPAVPLAGRDVNPQQAVGVLNLLARLETALRNEDDQELARLGPLLEKEVERFSLVRSEVGGRIHFLDNLEHRLLDQEVALQEFLSLEFDADMTEVITQVAQTSAVLEAVLRMGAQSMQLSLMNFL